LCFYGKTASANNSVGEWGNDPSAPDATESSSPNGGNTGHQSSDSDNSSTPTGAIAGGVVGGVAGLALIGGLIFFFLRRRRNAASQPIELDSPTSTAAPGTGHGYAPNGIVPGQAAHGHAVLPNVKADYSSSSPSTQFGGVANTTSNASPANSNGPYATPQDASTGGWEQAAPVEMPTTELRGNFVEMPTAGHERVEMEDNSRRELVG
jgi:LPXTG-motif cell wall-anchored protein